MLQFHWLLVFQLVYSTHSYQLQCPDISQRLLRASGYCTSRLLSKYTCLYDTNMLSYSEQCNRNPDFVTPGEKYVISGNLRNVDCSSERYQPFRLWSNVSGECLNQKSLCEGKGQVIFNNGSLIEERTCRCDYRKGYTFIQRPKQNCSCNPSEEDCTCHITKCPEGLVLSPDYECLEEKHHADSKCPLIEVIERDSLQRHNIQSYTDNRTQIRIGFIAVSIILVLVLAYTVILFFFWDEISEIEFTKGPSNRKGNSNQKPNLKYVPNDLSTSDRHRNSSDNVCGSISQENNTVEKTISQEKDQHDKYHKQQKKNEEEISRIKETLTTKTQSLQRDLFVSKQERDRLTQQLKSAEDKEQTRITLQLKQDSILQEKDTEIKRLKQLLNIKNDEIENKNCDIRHHETERRKFHNRIQELKGNIRVFCRVRPLLISETNEVITFPDEDREQKIIKLHKTGDAKLKGGKHAIKEHVFEFDKVFRGNAKQHKVFEELSQLVQSALDGYNVCIFAYGQTGSGKTYTMEGESTNVIDNKGMIPRAVLHILDKTKEIESIGWKYNLEMTFFEIYNETIRDLLCTEERKHEISMSEGKISDTVTNVSELTVEPFTEETKVYNLLQRASNNRSVGKTTGNQRSSRSHSVLTLQLIGNNSITDERSNGTLNMVDLAGSESIDSEATPQRQEETKAINKSLSTLGNVIMALGKGASHIPYRDSKLTKLLQNSLGGNSKTLMFVNVSPTKKCVKESLTSLRFAEKVNQCTIGIATKT